MTIIKILLWIIGMAVGIVVIFTIIGVIIALCDKRRYREITGIDYDPSLDPYPTIPLSTNYQDDGYNKLHLFLKFYFCDMYRAYLKNESYFDNNRMEFILTKLGFPTNIRNDIRKELKNNKNKYVELLSSTLSKRMEKITAKNGYEYKIGKSDVKQKNDIEELEMQYFISHNENAMLQAEKTYYENEDMTRIKQIINSLPSKLTEIDAFNTQLTNSINSYEQKAISAIKVAYGEVLSTSDINFEHYYKNYDFISTTYSSQLNTTVALFCDSTIKKITGVIQQKVDIINKNNQDKDKYNNLISKLQKQYDDEFALQKMRAINKEFDEQSEDNTDLAKKEENNAKIQMIVDDINQINQAVESRRTYEIEHGLINI